ncbi:MAG TPA: cytochrome c biogenesis protein CcsA [Bryobacteraceae bacterium]|nr:cytochrome c biogenesis protein CcsA [Bryobacteraceae bacterium]
MPAAKMLFLYAPAGFVAVLGFAVAVAASVLFLRTKALRFDTLAASATEVGLIFLTANIVAGVVWSRAAHAVWWTWDPAIASALVCALVYASYLMLRRAVEEPSQRAAFCAVWSIFCFLDTPIVIAAVYRWRSQHPHPALWADVPDAWPAPLAWSTAGMFALAALLLAVRLRQGTARREQDLRRRMGNTI